MTQSQTKQALEGLVREVRRQYDALPRGPQAVLRRCRTADDLRAEGTFWRLVDSAAMPAAERHRMAYVVVCFGAAPAGGEFFPPWLRRTVYGDVKWADLPARALRVRRLLATRDRDALVHELGHLLRHGFQKSRRGIDWGSLGADIFYWGDAVRRHWAEQFFTDTKSIPEETPDARDEG